MHTQLIVYACPRGTLAKQLDAYFTRARAQFSHNLAHDYMPHVTLTGFFPEDASAIPAYAAWLAQAQAEAQPIRPEPPLSIEGMHLTPDFHGLEIASPWIREVIRRFIVLAHSPTRPEAIRPKTWLHLSLAYGFPAEEDEPLRRLAQELVDPAAQVEWTLRLYERPPDKGWITHAEWSL